MYFLQRIRSDEVGFYHTCCKLQYRQVITAAAGIFLSWNYFRYNVGRVLMARASADKQLKSLQSINTKDTLKAIYNFPRTGDNFNNLFKFIAIHAIKI